MKRIREAYHHPQFGTDVLKPLKIDDLYDQEVQNLSGGELQRVAITLALGLPADIYLIDEPSAYLDSEQRIVAAKVGGQACTCSSGTRSALRKQQLHQLDQSSSQMRPVAVCVRNVGAVIAMLLNTRAAALQQRLAFRVVCRRVCEGLNMGCVQVIKRYIMHAKKTAFIVEHDFIMAAYLADRVIVYDGEPSKSATARTPQSLLTGPARPPSLHLSPSVC